jgi:hypothetical protein
VFPGAGASVHYNEAGEPLGWDYPSDDGPDDPGGGPDDDERLDEADDGPHDGVSAGARLWLLAGGGTVYVYDEGDPLIAHQAMMLDVVYPGDEVVTRSIPASRFDDTLIGKLRAEGLEVIDCRRADAGGGGEELREGDAPS